MEKKIVRFEIQDMLPIGLTLVVAGIGLVYGMSVMSDIKSDFCTGTREHMNNGVCYVCPNSTYDNFAPDNTCVNNTVGAANYNNTNISAGIGGDASVNASGNAITAVGKIPEKMPLIATVIIAAIIIGILVRYLMVRFQ